MTASKLVLNAASGASGGDTTDVDDVFSTFVYQGNSTFQAIENGIADLKKSLEGTDAEDIKKKTQSLIQVSMKLGEAVYKSQQKPEANKSGSPKDAKPDDKDNVVDADFEDVKDKEKEEDKEKSA